MKAGRACYNDLATSQKPRSYRQNRPKATQIGGARSRRKDIERMDREQARETIKGYLPDYLRGKGINTRSTFNCLSPEHPDKHPSMSYDSKRQRCKCFSCGISYDIFDIIGIDYGLTEFPDQLNKACELYGITIDGEGRRKPDREAKEGGADRKGKEAGEPMEETKKSGADNCMDYIKQAKANIKDPAAQDYLRQRGISEETAKNKWVGYDPEYKTFNKIEKNGKEFTEFTTWRALIIPTGENNYVARNIDQPAEPAKKNRYRKKGAVQIFNWKALYSADKPIHITEGELDALSIIEVGGQAVGLGSTVNSNKLISMLENKAPEQPLILSLDRDEEGQKAEEELASELERLHIPFYRRNPYGEAKDANEALLTDRGSFKAEIEANEKEAAAGKQPKGQLQPVGSFIDAFKQHRQENRQNIRTGFKSFDIALGGGFGNELYVLGAETGVGKSAIASVLAQNIAQAGIDVIYYALEMGRDEFIARGASSISAENDGISKGSAIKYGEILNDTYDPAADLFYRRPYSQYEGYVSEYARRYGEHLYIIEGGTEGTTAKAIKEAVTRFKKEKGTKQVAVFVDYLQLLAADPEDRAQRDFMTKMSEAVKVLKTLASQVGATVFIISSMANDRKGQRVNDASFKYSGDIGYTGGVLLGWNWEGVTTTSSEEDQKQARQTARETGYRKMTLEVLKNRSGAMANKTELYYYPAYNYITDSEYLQTEKEPDIF